MSNIIKAIINMLDNPITKITSYHDRRNRANSMGVALEEYVKDLFAGTINENDETVRNKTISEIFSYLGNTNNPPDVILKGGDAIEVKKIESIGSALALNSSYPKHKLYSNSSMITNECKICEGKDWIEKDLIYTIGVVKNNQLSNLAMVYGVDYAAKDEVYKRISDTISDGVNSITGVEFSKTRELGRVNRVDPLGITYLRVRGMWGIENPFKVFNYIYERDRNAKFNFMGIINHEKYYSLKYIDDLESMVGNIKNFKMKDIEIKNPNNPSQLKEAKLITFSY